MSLHCFSEANIQISDIKWDVFLKGYDKKITFLEQTSFFHMWKCFNESLTTGSRKFPLGHRKLICECDLHPSEDKTSQSIL